MGAYALMGLRTSFPPRLTYMPNTDVERIVGRLHFARGSSPATQIAKR